MKKIIAVALFCLLTFLCVVSCADDKTNESSANEGSIINSSQESITSAVSSEEEEKQESEIPVEGSSLAESTEESTEESLDQSIEVSLSEDESSVCELEEESSQEESSKEEPSEEESSQEASQEESLRPAPEVSKDNTTSETVVDPWDNDRG